MEKLRKCTFSLDKIGMSMYERGFEESEVNETLEIAKEHEGLFHRWGDICKYDATIERNTYTTVGIVEETTTGKVYEVKPERITFTEKL